MIIALVLCPFTAPFASYDPNASAIGDLLTEDGSLLDIGGNKAIPVAAFPIPAFAFANVAGIAWPSAIGTTLDLLLVRSVVLRV